MKKLFAMTAAAVTISAASAVASPISVSWQTSGNAFGTADLKERISISTTGPEIDGDVYAGMFALTSTSTGDFSAFCVDLADYLTNPQSMTSVASLFSTTVETNLAKLFDAVLGGSTMEVGVDSAAKAAALQVAVWEVVYDSATGFDLSSGAFSMSNNSYTVSDVKGNASTYLAALSGGSTTEYGLSFLEATPGQDLVTATPGGGGTTPPVPLPASGILLAAALGGLVASRKRRSA